MARTDDQVEFGFLGLLPGDKRNSQILDPFAQFVNEWIGEIRRDGQLYAVVRFQRADDIVDAIEGGGVMYHQKNDAGNGKCVPYVRFFPDGN